MNFTQTLQYKNFLHCKFISYFLTQTFPFDMNKFTSPSTGRLLFYPQFYFSSESTIFFQRLIVTHKMTIIIVFSKPHPQFGSLSAKLSDLPNKRPVLQVIHAWLTSECWSMTWSRRRVNKFHDHLWSCSSASIFTQKCFVTLFKR